MSEPRFLSLVEVERLHAISLDKFGGSAGTRDAATYAYHIAESQAFIDGNKRTAVLAAVVFLKLNGIICSENTVRFYDAMIAIAEKRLDKKGLADVFRKLCSPQS